MNDDEIQAIADHYGEKWTRHIRDAEHDVLMAHACAAIMETRNMHPSACSDAYWVLCDVSNGDGVKLDHHVLVCEASNDIEGMESNYLDYLGCFLRKLRDVFNHVWVVELESYMTDSLFSVAIGVGL